MSTSTHTFRHVGGCLLLDRSPRSGIPYTHVCRLDTFAAVAHWIEGTQGGGFTTGELWEAMPDHPRTQVSVALAFLKEHSLVVDLGFRRHSVSIEAARPCFYEHAMCEWHALRELGRDQVLDDAETGAIIEGMEGGAP